MSLSRFESIPAWRIARLRRALGDAMQRGGDATDSGEGLEHRAQRRRFAMGRLSLATAGPARRKTTRKGLRFPLSKQIAIWRAIFAIRPAQWRPGDRAPVGSIKKAHHMAVLACRDLDLPPPRYRTVYVLWHNGVPSAEVMRTLSDEVR